MKTLYDILGLEPGATADEIKSAYRSHSKIHHPDSGGDSEAFQRGHRAYDVLSDSEKRARYDETGDGGENIDPLAMQAAAFLLMAVRSMVDDSQYNLNKTDCIDLLRNVMRKHLDFAKGSRRGFVERIADCENFIGRVTHNGGGNNIIVAALKNDLRDMQAALVAFDAQFAAKELAIKMVGEYSYMVDPEPQALPMPEGMTATAAESMEKQMGFRPNPKLFEPKSFFTGYYQKR